MKIINLTPHDIVVKTEDREIVFPASGEVARVEMLETSADPVYGIPTITRKPSKVVGIPPRQDGTWYIVSALVFDASPRMDLLCPDTGSSAIRDENGRIQAVTRLVRRS